MGRWGQRLAMGVALLAAGMTHAVDDRDVDVIVGRADADASGGWPVAVWVHDGERSHIVLRAPRAQLATLPGQPWEATDAQAVLDLERYGAPRLVGKHDRDPCPTTLRWMWSEANPPRIIHVPDEREALQHPSCGAVDCAGQAWSIGVPPGPVLPLRRLMPHLAARQPEWLVLYVVSPAEALRLDGLPLLDVPASLRSGPPWRRSDLPGSAGSLFPALHAALLEKAAADQGHAHASLLMRSDMQTTVQPLRFSRLWKGSDAHRQALGLAPASVQGHYIVRLLLRLHPGDRPVELRLQPVPRDSIATFRTLSAAQPWPRTEDSCRSALDEMDCEAACTRRVAALPRSLVSRFGQHTGSASAPEDVAMQTCRIECQSQKRQVAATMAGELDAVPQRQERAWRWVEELTGRPADSWQAR